MLLQHFQRTNLEKFHLSPLQTFLELGLHTMASSLRSKHKVLTRVPQYHKMALIKLSTARLSILSIRSFSSNYRSSKFIRQQFLDFFIKDNQHNFVKSSSVIPFCDPTLSFCNAGMNQFKHILLGNQEPKYRRVANSQKCIRVGGKHNDLSIVGSDSYHHTFFEMLGNWSFGDYFKKDACNMAWKLLTEVYKIPPERLYVTYFKGDEKMGLQPDHECREIWREIGMADNRIIGFGAKENFWEMGASGPCGGCSEIHVDHLPSFRQVNRAVDVNQDKSDLTELWNIVFIEHFRNVDGSITKLPEQHIDTGMGFERLVSFLQDKSSNYDSDLFVPIFEKIQKVTDAPKYSGAFEGANCQRDTGYRVIADHSRMVAVSLADGMFPEQNQKLRRVLRKCIKISENEFKNDNLLIETIPVVSEILGESFTELNDRLFQVLEIVKYEQDLFKSLRKAMSKDVDKFIKQNPKLAELDVFDYPGFVQGYQDLMNYKKSNQHLSGDATYYFHSSFGFDLDFIEQLAEIEGMTVDSAGFETKLNKIKQDFRDKQMNPEMITAIESQLTIATKNDLKYDYTFDGVHQLYKLDPVKSKILSIVYEKGCVPCTTQVSSRTAKIILDSSPFYYESGGQESDGGFICKNGKKFLLKTLSSRKNCVLHEIELCNDETLQVGDEVDLEVDPERRTAATRNHSATHLLNSAIRHVTKFPIYQKSSLVTSECLKIELSCLGPKLNHTDLKNIECLIQEHIKERPLQRQIRVLNSQDLQNESDVVMVPGEVYPDEGIRLVTFGDFSKELCCGTHVFNTKELQEFTFLTMRSTGRNSYLFTATTGPSAVHAIEVGGRLVDQLKKIDENITAENAVETLIKLRAVSTKLNNSNLPTSFLKKIECQTITASIKEKMKKESKEILEIEMKKVVEKTEKDSFVIHFLACSEVLKSITLERATKFIKDKPVLIISYSDSSVRARCCVPKHLITKKFNAETWVREVSKIFSAQSAPPKGQDGKETCLMKEKNIHPEIFDELLQDGISDADEFASEHTAAEE